MTNHCPKKRVAHHLEVILKISIFRNISLCTQNNIKQILNQNSTCEWCITLILWPIVYFHMTIHCPKRQGWTRSGSILKKFYFQQYFPMHSEWFKIYFKQNRTCEWCTTLIFWPIVYLHMTNHCPKSQGFTPSGGILKNFHSPQCFSMH